MSGKRRRSWCVRKSYFNDGKRTVEYLGYFETRTEALNFLAKYNMTPKEKGVSLTFSQVYEMWSEWHYPNLTTSTIESYVASYNKCSTLYKCNFIDITQSALQGVIDNDKSNSGKHKLYSLFKCMWKYAEKKEIITSDKNRVKFLDIPKVEKSTLHRRLTNEELCVLWEHRDEEIVAIFLILIYTGCRPMELFSLTPNQVYENYFEILDGKTENAKRLVPIHNEIKPLFKYMKYDISTKSSYVNWTTCKFKPYMKELGIECTLYDARHTFATLWAENRLDEAMRRSIQGHSQNGVGQQVYTHYDIEILLEEVNKLPITHKRHTNSA